MKYTGVEISRMIDKSINKDLFEWSLSLSANLEYDMLNLIRSFVRYCRGKKYEDVQTCLLCNEFITFMEALQ